MSVEAPLPAAYQQEALKPSAKPSNWLLSNVEWVKNVLPNLFCVPVYMSWWTVYTQQMPQVTYTARFQIHVLHGDLKLHYDASGTCSVLSNV